MYLSGNEIRQKFLEFYQEREHQILESASLIPDDPTVLLTIAGMLPFKPIFLGQETSKYLRATSSQKCIRTNDIENVGKTARHHTFFEMLGNFSFGDYFKEQAIMWGWELSTTVFQLPPERIVISVYEEDDEAFAIWQDKIGVNPKRIIRLGKKDNFWNSGPTGPCGPCSELYYDFAPELGNDNIDLEDDSRFIEFYNLVFMQYNQDAQGNLTPLQNQNIDTGMGLERMAQILQQCRNNYETDLIFPIINTASDIANLDYITSPDPIQTSLKVIGDHVRAVVHLIADGVRASNLGRGYVLRRLIRRVVRHGKLIGIVGQFISKVAQTAISLGESVYPHLREQEELIKGELDREEVQFLNTLERGEKLLDKIMTKVRDEGLSLISGKDAFLLFGTYGFPLELTQEIAAEYDLMVDVAEYYQELKLEQDRSRDAQVTIDLTVQGSIDTLANQIHPTGFIGYQSLTTTAVVVALFIAGKSVTQADVGSDIQVILDRTSFYAESGGQVADQGVLVGDDLQIKIVDVQKEGGFFIHKGVIEQGILKLGDSVTAMVDHKLRTRIKCNHTATHLLQSALKLRVDNSISQAGSLVTSDRLRFDFNCPRPLTLTEIQLVEDQVNSWILQGHSAIIDIMTLAQAKAKGAIAMFGEKYGSEVRVIDFPSVSMELCGGTHVANTNEIGLFKIISESGVASGVRRIEAISGQSVLDYLKVRDLIVQELGDRFKVKPEEVVSRISSLQNELKVNQKEIESLRAELAIAKSDQLLDQVHSVGEYKIIVAELPAVTPDALSTAAQRLLHKITIGAIVLGTIPEPNKVSIVAAFSQEVIKNGLKAGQFIDQIAKICGGGGGGRPNLAQAGGRHTAQLNQALETALRELKSKLG